MIRLIASVLLLAGLSGCVEREQLEAALWLNNGMDAALCGPSKEDSPHPELWDYGFYRKLNSGKIEFIAYCSPIARKWISIYKRDFNLVMDGLLPEGPPKSQVKSSKKD